MLGGCEVYLSERVGRFFVVRINNRKMDLYQSHRSRLVVASSGTGPIVVRLCDLKMRCFVGVGVCLRARGPFETC